MRVRASVRVLTAMMLGLRGARRTGRGKKRYECEQHYEEFRAKRPHGVNLQQPSNLICTRHVATMRAQKHCFAAGATRTKQQARNETLAMSPIIASLIF